jgi:hypothetical protein
LTLDTVSGTFLLYELDPLRFFRNRVGKTVHSEIRDALNRARKDRDRFRTLVLSTLLSDIRNREIEIGREADDDAVREVIARGIKQRHESAEQMRAGAREDLAENEERQSGVLAEFLPPAMEEGEVRALVRGLLEQGPREMGPVMGRLMPKIRGRFDGKEANRIVREELGR